MQSSSEYEFIKTAGMIPLLLIASFAAVNVYSQTRIDEKQFVGKSFRTKFVTAAAGDCEIKITPQDVSPDEETSRRAISSIGFFG